MAKFKSQRAAKEYLAGMIAAEAEREGKPLSEIEHKMLYFSETDWTLPGMAEINADFERGYDGEEYERTIARLARSIEDRLKQENEEESGKWYTAIEKLSEGDHYLLILLLASSSNPAGATRPPGDLLKLWLTGFGIALGGIALIALWNRMLYARFRLVMDWLDHRDPFYLVLLLVILIWFLRSKFRAALLALWNRR